MDKLDPESLAFLAAYRETLDPPSEARARVWAAVVEQTVLTTTTRRRKRMFAIATGIAVAAACASLWWFQVRAIDRVPAGDPAYGAVYTEEQPNELKASVPEPVPVAKRTPSTPPALGEPQPQQARESQTVVHEPPRRETRRQKPQPKRTATPVRADSIADELRVLQRAEKNLQQQQYAKALASLDEHQRRFGESGQLVPEVTASRVTALCGLGRREAARKLKQSFLSKWPRSPLRARVLAACEDGSNFE